MSASRPFAPGAIDGPHRRARRALAHRRAARVLLLWVALATVGLVAGWLS